MSEKGRLLSRDDICREYNISKRLLEDLAYKGQGPRRVKLGHRTVRYWETDVITWINDGVVETNVRPG